MVSRPPTTSTAAPSIRQPLAGQQQEEDQAGVKVTGLPVATLTDTGQYLVSSGSSSQSYDFNLLKINGQWRIDTLPTSQLLLTQADFERVYQPRDLYFLAQSGRTLVPDPVFVPQQATNTELATGLVKALLQDPEGLAVRRGPDRVSRPASSSSTTRSSSTARTPSSTWAGSTPPQPHGSWNRWPRSWPGRSAAGRRRSSRSSSRSTAARCRSRGASISFRRPTGSWVPTQPADPAFTSSPATAPSRSYPAIGQPGSGRAAAVPGPAGTAARPAPRRSARSPSRPTGAGWPGLPWAAGPSTSAASATTPGCGSGGRPAAAAPR